MEREEARQIAEEIETEEFDGEDGTEEEQPEEDFDALYGDDEDPEREVVQVTETITVVKQPIITTVTVGAEVGAKGEVKPVCKVSIERHHEGEDGADVEVFDIIAQDFAELADQVKVQTLKLKKDTGMN